MCLCISENYTVNRMMFVRLFRVGEDLRIMPPSQQALTQGWSIVYTKETVLLLCAGRESHHSPARPGLNPA